ncbi:MAG TPA: SAM-dependent methyltransferase [Geminicoccaceae bacterium]|nr:SAM-dependent methyltransferase [Geminicoccaceae bacterium]
MSDLRAVLTAEIRARGPLSVARFMALALGHPDLGYYRRQNPLGAAGDFVTAPEVSQMFGEIMGLWLAETWSGLGRPAPARLVELGPGRGTLMTDLLRATARLESLRRSLSIHLVETSGRLREVQAGRLAGVSATWHDDLGEVPQGSLLLVANEFLDALPVHQLVRTEEDWVERRVGLADDGALTFVLDDRPSPLAEQVPERDAAAPGAVAEVSPARAALARQIGERIAASGGVALLVDYGAWATGPTGDTLQAVRGHAPCAPLACPGEADLSAQVDFRAFAEAACAGGAAVYGPVPQGTFLRALGIEARALQLLGRAGAEQRRGLRADLFRLTDPSAMGEVFKVLVLTSPNGPPPPGFGAPTMLSR